MRGLIWVLVAGLGALGYAVMAFHRGGTINSAYLVLAAVCTYAIGYRFYAKWLATRVLLLDDRRATPCHVKEDGRDFVKTDRWIVFGHHFAAISGPGPLVGPVLAAQFGYLPSALWILIGVVLGGAVQDFIILYASMRRGGRSLGQMVRDELGSLAGQLAMAAILVIMVILLGVLALIVVKVLADSPWGVFTVGATIPIALGMGGYLRYLRPGRTLEASIGGVILLMGAVWGGQYVHSHAELARQFTWAAHPLAWIIIVYGFAASVLPVWLLLAPRDYLSTFMKLGTIVALALGVVLVWPELHMPAVTKFADGSGPVVPGTLFPFCFITIACGAISGFHSLISSGITPKIVDRESDARVVGYGAMCLESLVAIMALIAACALEPGVYLAMNIAGTGPDAAAVAADTVAKVNATGFPVTAGLMDQLAVSVGEQSLYGRTGGAATLAVGMATIFARVTAGRWLDIWYHFAVMFEALFILTTLDAGTRVGRYLLQDFLGHLSPALGNTRSWSANALASGLIVAGWGFVLVNGVINPDGGTKALWPIFGIANQLLAAIALCLATTILLKRGLQPSVATADGTGGGPARRQPALALVTLVPLLWLLAVTFTAGGQKIWHPSPKIGFIAGGRAAAALTPKLESAVAAAEATGNPVAVKAAKQALARNQIIRFNAQFDWLVTALFLAFAAVLFLLSLSVWMRLLSGRLVARWSEDPPTWLPAGAMPGAASGPGLAGIVTLGLALLRVWSGQAEVDREATLIAACAHREAGEAPPLRLLIDLPEVRTDVRQLTAQQAYVEAAEHRLSGTSRCC